MMPARILLVEDNVMNRQLLRVVLEYRGHSVTEATTVGDALIALRGKPFDVVLTDIQLPGGGGEDLLRQARALGTQLPVVAVTAQAMAGDRERLLAVGFSGYISKPIDTATFASTVESYLTSGELP